VTEPETTPVEPVEPVEQVSVEQPGPEQVQGLDLEFGEARFGRVIPIRRFGGEAE
jgi:hypothetical protein